AGGGGGGDARPCARALPPLRSGVERAGRQGPAQRAPARRGADPKGRSSAQVSSGAGGWLEPGSGAGVARRHGRQKPEPVAPDRGRPAHAAAVAPPRPPRYFGEPSALSFYVRAPGPLTSR